MRFLILGHSRCFVRRWGEEKGREYVDLFLFICRKHAKKLKAVKPHPPTLTHINTTAGSKVWKCWHTVKSSPRNPKNPPEYMQDGRVRWSLGMHLEESVTYLLAELSEPCLSQILPPRPVCSTSSSYFLSCSLTYTNSSLVPHVNLLFADKHFLGFSLARGLYPC